MGNLCWTNFHQRHDDSKRPPKRFVNDFQDRKTFKGQNYFCWSWCTKRQTYASSSWYPQFKGSNADSLLRDSPIYCKGRWPKDNVFTSFERGIREMILLKAIMQQLLLIKLNEHASNEGVSHRKITAVL